MRADPPENPHAVRKASNKMNSDLENHAQCKNHGDTVTISHRP